MKPGSKGWKNFMSKLYGFGAAVVIVGAMFKIMHWPGASMMLIIGLSVEALIFIFSAFEPIHDEVDWTLVYPELALGHDHDDEEIEGLELSTPSRHKNNNGIAGELDNLLAEAKIDSELIQSLGDGMRNLSETAGKISNVADATAESANYTQSLKKAAEKVDKLADAYTTASESLMGLTSTQEEGASFGEQMQKVTANLSALNSVYEAQLKGASDSLEATTKIQSGITELMTNLSDSVEDTRNYKTNIAELSKNLSALNKVYSNMLNAMNMNPNA